MTVVKSRVKKGSLKLKPDAGLEVDFSCQPTNVTVTTEYNEQGELLEVLCGDIDPPEIESGRMLKVTAVQDFDNPDGFQKFLWDNEKTVVDFTWVPNDVATGPTFTGRMQCRVGDIGGDVAAQLTSDLEFPCIGDVTITYPE